MAALPGFDHEGLDVYQVALEFASFTHAVLAQLPRGRGALGEQLMRASLSIGANVAEGAGEFSRREKARFYRIALRSATECASLLDMAERFRAIRSDQKDRGKALLHRIVAMLLAMLRRLGEEGDMGPTARGPGPGRAPPGPRFRAAVPGPEHKPSEQP